MLWGTKVFGIVLSLFFLLSVAPAGAEDRSFEIGQVDIYAVIDAEGNMQITERDTYRFDGDFNGILVDLNKEGSDGLEKFTAYEVSDEGHIPLEFGQSGDGDVIQYKVYSKSVDTMKVFEISYTVRNVVQVYADTAELYWNFFDETNANALGKVNIEIKLPEGITKDKIIPFGHGPLDGVIQVQGDRTVHFQADSLPANKMLETRVLFPAEYVPGSKRISDEPMMDKILEKERNWREDGEPESSNDYTVPYALLLLLANLAAGFTIYFRFRRAPKSDWQGSYYRELPSDVSPAVVSYLLDSRIESRDLMATLLDLVRRKYVVMKKLGSPKIGKDKHDYSFEWRNKNTEGLLPHEKMLLEWFFDKIGDGNKVTLSEIRFEASLRADFPKKWSEWQGKVKEEAVKQHYLRTNSGIYRWVILIFLVQFIGFLFFVPTDWRWLMFCALPLPFFKPKRVQRTRNGQTEYEKWKAFGHFLRAYSRIEKRDTMDVHLWDHSFVYAIPLGAAKKMIKDTKIKILNQNDSGYGDFTLYQSAGIVDFEQLSRLFTETVSESQKSTGSDGSSDSGGWFSSGGGDGGGGGGRGAF
jgi:Predicted membrane protein